MSDETSVRRSVYLSKAERSQTDELRSEVYKVATAVLPVSDGDKQPHIFAREKHFAFDAPPSQMHARLTNRKDENAQCQRFFSPERGANKGARNFPES